MVNGKSTLQCLRSSNFFDAALQRLLVQSSWQLHIRHCHCSNFSTKCPFRLFQDTCTWKTKSRLASLLWKIVVSFLSQWFTLFGMVCAVFRMTFTLFINMYSIEMQTFYGKFCRKKLHCAPFFIQKEWRGARFPILNLSWLKLLPVSQFHMPPFRLNHGHWSNYMQ